MRRINLIKENISAFRAGTFGGIGVWGGKLLGIKAVSPGLADIGLRTIAAGCAALATGLMAALAADIYKHKIKPKFFKDKDDETQKRA